MADVTLDHLNAASEADFVAALGGIFEHSPWIAEAAAAGRPFARLADLYQALVRVLNTAPDDSRLALIKAHPDLAGKAALAGTLTAASAAEQIGAGLDLLTVDEFTAFERLNAAYAEKFGFPFIVCVGRRTKEFILRDFAARLDNSREAETAAAIAEICRIAALRLDQAVSASDRLPVHGRLSTHVLDAHAGRPAAGVAVSLVELAEAGPFRTVVEAVTNADGRTDAPLMSGRPLPMGRYELRFAVGDYFARAPDEPGAPPFLDVVPVAFGIAEPEGSYHVPLLVTPWSYTTYRGS